ncbi:hypothetical protein BJP05_01545 [Corynebacterium sp. NML98-0116]|uniref:Uncharacterized protein n=1 Tax=Corynebacterium lipophilum TaxID=2804918 RepID=A0AAW5HUI9_9CORY|nr:MULTISPECIES: hypothetical protein [Corynebacterium]AOX05005.1 hypothetical protein BJP05_01545 [Corynebacterium sp. NML98-0116]MCO6394650.1 hypothetical protein [Corynebacterium lipophilum]MCQ4610400.1 hypothetical protein [Corynebacterium sp. CCUG 61414]MCQ4612396.1 hypothetical protein [Corynebacterium sp. CCUG 51687]MCQ4616668.1 hypothetical protein [Corynebacterium pseudogenitalium]
MTTRYPQRRKDKAHISSVDPEIVAALLEAAETSRHRTDEFMARRYPEDRSKNRFWKSYFLKKRA